MALIKRSLLRHFLNTTPMDAATWTLMNQGIPSGKISYNPKTTSETYIHEDTASQSIDGYSPSMAVESKVTAGEALFTYLDTLRIARSTLSDAETEIVTAMLYKGSNGGKYLAEKRDCSIRFDKVGGPGGSPALLNYTIGFIGNPIPGLFDPLALAFVAADESARLASLVIGASPLVLTPAFRSKRIWYKAATAAATDTIDAVAEDESTTIAIDVDGVTVANGDPATWAAGLNHVTITCTNSGKTSIYTVLVTKS